MQSPVDAAESPQVAVVLCAEDAVAQACSVEIPVVTTTSTTTETSAATSSTTAKSGPNNITARLFPSKGQRICLQRSCPADIMGVMPPNVAAFWKFVDGWSGGPFARLALTLLLLY